MMEQMLPAEIVSVESWGDDDSAFLLPAERAQSGNAIESRISEFATARSCARQALNKLGISPDVILRGSKGEPIWPSGVIGSITHCAGYRAAAVAPTAKFAAIGIDAEIHDALPPEVLESVCVPEEIAWLDKASDEMHWDRVLFSAKESIYKAWFPLTKSWLGFEQVVVTVDVARHTFYARVLDSMPDQFAAVIRQLSGRFLIRSGIILTCAFSPTRF